MQIRQLLFGLILLVTGFAYSASAEVPTSSEVGWFWGYMQELLDQEKERLAALEEAPKPLNQNPDSEQDCTKADEWSTECGFIHPGADFEFQAKQRDALLENAAMNSSKPEEVIKFQKYLSWAVDQAITMANVWEWNMTQNPELNPRLTIPVTGFGIRAATANRKAHQRSIVEEITAQEGFLVWFTRKSCEACALMVDPLERLERQTGIKIYAASLDNACHGKFECITGEEVIAAATVLNVSFTPDIWLHLPKDDNWFRVSAGIETDIQIIERLELFFGAIKHAAVQGLSSAMDSSLPAIDFSMPEIPSKNLLGEGIYYE